MEESANAVPPPAIYVNFLQVAHNQAEFFMAFGQLAKGQAGRGHLASSLVTSPAHAKAMLGALREAIERYEARFGEIPAIERTPGPDSSAYPPGGRAAKPATGRAA